MRGHTNGRYTWDGKRFAVVTPFRDLFPQLITINPYDTFILGDFQLSTDSFIVLPEEDLHLIDKPEVAIYTYDTKTTSLRNAIRTLIHDLEGWKIQMYNNASTPSLAFMDDININTPEFFSPVFSKYPRVSFGMAVTPFFGVGYRIKMIDHFLTELSGFDLGFGTSNSPNLHYSLVEYCINKSKQDISLSSLPPSSKATFTDHILLAQNQLKILRTKYDTLKADPSWEIQKAYSLATMPPSDLGEFLLIYPEQFPNVKLFNLYYRFRRILLIGQFHAQAEGTWDAVRAGIAGLSELGSEKNILEAMLTTVILHLEENSTYRINAIELLHTPEFEAALRTYFDTNISDLYLPEKLIERLNMRTRGTSDTR